MSLTGKQIKNTYQGLLNLNSINQGFDTSAQSVLDGLGVASPLSLATDKVLIHGNVYPTSSGINGQVITTDGAGQLNWSSVLTETSGDARYAQLNADNTFTGVNTFNTAINYFNLNNNRLWESGIYNTTGALYIQTSGDVAKAYRFEPEGTLTQTRSVVTRDTGDIRYAQLSAVNIFTDNSIIANMQPQLTFEDTNATAGYRLNSLQRSGDNFAIILRTDGGILINEPYVIQQNSIGATRHIFQVSAVPTAYIEGVGTSLPVPESIVTREKGDVRYALVPSDENLKENIIDAVSALPIIESLRPVMYNFKADISAKQHFGLIAQEVQQVLPNAIIHGGEWLGLEMRDLIGLLIKANQELLARIKILEGN